MLLDSVSGPTRFEQLVAFTINMVRMNLVVKVSHCSVSDDRGLGE